MAGKMKDYKDEAVDAARKIVTSAASGVERIVTSEETHQAIEGGKNALRRGKRAIVDTVQSGRRVASRVRGGVSTIAGKVSDTYDTARGGLEEAYGRFEDAFYTEGKLDKEKVQMALSDKARAVRDYGLGAVNFLAREVKIGAGAVVEKYREMAPTRTEIETYRKDGIGVGYHGIMFKQDLEKCKTFRDKAMRLLDFSVTERDTILSDIGGNIIGSKTELLAYYKEQGKEDLYKAAKKNL